MDQVAFRSRLSSLIRIAEGGRAYTYLFLTSQYITLHCVFLLAGLLAQWLAYGPLGKHFVSFVLYAGKSYLGKLRCQADDHK